MLNQRWNCQFNDIVIETNGWILQRKIVKSWWYQEYAHKIYINSINYLIFNNDKFHAYLFVKKIDNCTKLNVKDLMININ